MSCGKRGSGEEFPSSDPAAAPKKAKMASNGVGGDAMDIDEALHSRQLAVYGREVMRRMAGASVLITGLSGLGVEIGEGAAVRRRGGTRGDGNSERGGRVAVPRA